MNASKRIVLRCTPRFALRTVLILVGILAVYLGGVVIRVSDQRKAVATIKEIEGLYGYNFQFDDAGHRLKIHATPGPQFLVDMLGIDYFATVVYADPCQFEGRCNDDTLKRLTKLKRLRDLELYDANITDKGLRHLLKFRRLQSLALFCDGISDTGLEHVRSLPRLRMLHLGAGPSITSDGLCSLIAELPPLQVLQLDGPPVTPEVLSQVATHRNLHRLCLRDTSITDESIRQLQALHKLRWLEIRSKFMTDQSREHLVMLRKLAWLHIDKTSFTDAGLQALINKMPWCKVVAR